MGLFIYLKVSNVNYINHHKEAFTRLAEDGTMTHVHLALYNAMFLLWNQTGFKDSMSIHRSDVMQLAGIGNTNTYTKALKHLHDRGFIIYKPSFNPLIASQVTFITTLCRSDKGIDKGTAQGTAQGSGIGIAPLHKPINKETIKPLNYINSARDSNQIPFERFWDLYDKKVDLAKSKKAWEKLKNEDRIKIMDFIPKYKHKQPDKKFRRNPTTFFNTKFWESELPDEYTPPAEKKDRGAFDTLSDEDRQKVNSKIIRF